MKDRGAMFIWIGATLMAVSMLVLAIRMAVLYVDAFSRALVGALDAEWWQRALSGNLWATMRLSMLAVLGAMLLAGGLISKRRARRRMALRTAHVGLN